jgi:hypothetical protein
MIRPKRSWLSRAIAALLASVAAASVLAVVTPSAAQAGSFMGCSDGHFCWYAGTNYSGYIGAQYFYTDGYVRMSSLVDNSESSVERQTADGNCYHVEGIYIYRRPWVYLKDTSPSTDWVSRLGKNFDQRTPDFNGISTNHGRLNMRNRFNDIWNWC